MAMAPPTCVATNVFEWKTCLLVRRGDSCHPRYVQKCTEEGSRGVCGIRDSGNGGDCPINLFNHSGHGLLLFPVQVVAIVAEGVFGSSALFGPAEAATVS